MAISFSRRLVFNALPVLLIIGSLWVAVFGESGLLAGNVLKQHLYSVEAANERLLLENQQTKSRIVAIRTNREILAREAAEHLLIAPEGSVIYRFTR